MAADLFDRFTVIDVDTHITEPRDTWELRMPSKWGDRIPHIERVEGQDVWMADGQRIATPGSTSMAGWKGVIPDSPRTFDDIHPSMYDAKARVQHMDEQGIRAQVLYPNVGGFGAGYFLRMAERELANDCVRAYNEFQHDWTSIAPDRLLAVTALPFWDVELSVKEIFRAKELGHRAVNFCNQPEGYGMPPLGSRHWDPIWAAAGECAMPISFHIGGGDIGPQIMNGASEYGFQANFAKVSSILFIDNMRCMADLIFGGVCHRFPGTNFVSVESGIGWVPGALEAFDWQWRNGGISEEHPEYDLLPSEYFRRQIYACFWFEREAAVHAIERYPDNVLFETDFPHPTCQHPGPRTPAVNPREYASEALRALSDELLEKVLHANAARIYGLA